MTTEEPNRDTPKQTASDESLWDEMQEAFWGAYDVAPSGEGAMGASDFGCRAAILVLRGMKAPEAVAFAIGETGNYGIQRKYGIIPRPVRVVPSTTGPSVYIEFASNEERDQCIRGVE